MKDVLKKIQDARKEGYSDEEISSFLGKENPKVLEAVNEGYSLDEIGSFLEPKPTFAGAAKPEKTTGLMLRGAIQGAAALPNMIADPLYQMAGATPPSQGLRNTLTQMGLPEFPQTAMGRMTEAGTEALSGAGSQIAAAAKMGGQVASRAGRNILESFSAKPTEQLIAAGTSAPVAQGVAEFTGSPVAGMVAGMATGAASGVRPRPTMATTKEQIRESISEAYKKVNESNILIRTDAFNKQMDGITKDLRSKGFSPTNSRFKDLASMIDEIKTNTQPKDIVELKTIREQITMSANPQDKDAYRLMKIVRDRFDNYILNLPENQIMAGSKDDMKAWKEARQLFQKDKKAEVFEDMLINAPVSKGQFSQSGTENYLYNELKKLSRNKTKMATFTKEEQEAIRKAASGSGLQNALKFVGRFAPTGAVPLISTLGVGAFDPGLASGMAATSLAARYGAEKIRLGDTERLINMMRTGQQQPTMFQAVPQTTMRGLLSSEELEQ